MKTGSGLRNALKRVPGLAPAYRGLRAGWQGLRARANAFAEERRAAVVRKRHAAAVWDQIAAAGAGGERARGWLTCSQVLLDYVFPKFGGRDWYDYVRETCCPHPRDLGLSLCCGEGAVERHMIKRQIVRACEGVDISPQSVAVCRAAAEAEGMSTLTYRVGDVENLPLPRDTYDLVVGWMALHHLADPGRVFARVSRALRPDGVFIVNEYIGPPRFQMPSLQAELIDEWVRKLPEELRRTATGIIRQGFTPPTVAQVIARDSSEAIASDRILPELEQQFVITERVDYGGVLLQWLLEDTAHNFDRHNPEHQAWLDRLYEAERDILRRGLLKSDFTFIIARPGGN